MSTPSERPRRREGTRRRYIYTLIAQIPLILRRCLNTDLLIDLIDCSDFTD